MIFYGIFGAIFALMGKYKNFRNEGIKEIQMRVRLCDTKQKLPENLQKPYQLFSDRVTAGVKKIL